MQNFTKKDFLNSIYILFSLISIFTKRTSNYDIKETANHNCSIYVQKFNKKL